MDITSTHPRWGIEPSPPPPPPAPSVVAEDIGNFEDIVVSGSLKRMPGVMMSAPVMVAQQEELGDLKLYRIPEPVTVAALSRKQVAMIDRKKVAFARVYTGDFEQFDYDRDADEPESRAAERILRTENIRGKGLGLPLPAGRVAVFERARKEALLVGEGALSDRAIGEEVEFATGESSDLRYKVVARPPSRSRQPYVVEVTNARSTPEAFEMAIPYKLASSSAKLIERKGLKTWQATVPANGTARLEFALKLEVER
jgi:hypothetical protein